MSAAALFDEAKELGVELRVVAGSLRAMGPEECVSELLPRLKAEKTALIRLLSGRPDLCRLLGEVVETRYGRGRLWQVFQDRAAVVIEPGRLTFMDPQDITIV